MGFKNWIDWKSGIVALIGVVIYFIILLILILTLVGVSFRTKAISKIGIRNELFLGFFITIVTTMFVGLGAYYMLYTAKKEADIRT